jgi:CRISPR-associated protein Cas1
VIGEPGNTNKDPYALFTGVTHPRSQMSALPILPEPDSRRLPDYLPARMVNQFTYCPRLFFYEWVEGVFRESADTVEGKAQHARVDAKSTKLPTPEEAAQEEIHSRSVTLSSERLRVIAKLDLLEGSDGVVTPVDYKHGRPVETAGGLDLWPTDRVQLGVQGLILRENGYRCEEGVGYYAKTKQRVRVVFDEEFMRETEAAISRAWETAAAGVIPPPLEDSPKCGGCSLVGICLPDETSALRWSAGSTDCAEQLGLFEPDGAGTPRKPVRAANQVRRLIAPRDELRPVYLDTQGLRVGKSGEVLQVREKDDLKQEIRIGEICQLSLMGNVQLSTQAVQTLCEAGVPICYFSQGGWFYGITTGLNAKNVFLRKSQFRLAEEEWFALSLARQLVAGKIRNQRTMLQRNHAEPRAESLTGLKQMIERAERARGLDERLGIEGNAARIYFGDLAGMIKTAEGDGAGAFPFDFTGRNRRPPPRRGECATVTGLQPACQGFYDRVLWCGL